MFAGSSRYSWSLEKLWYVPVFCFGWLVVKKLRFEKTLVAVWLYVRMKTGLRCSFKTAWSCVLSSVRAARLGRSSSAVWVRARAPRRCCLDPFGVRARGTKALTPRNETPAHHLPQTDATSDNTLDTTDKTDTPSHLDRYYPYPVVVFLLFETKVGNFLQIISIRRILLKSGVKEVTYWRYTNMATSGSKQYLLFVYLN